MKTKWKNIYDTRKNLTSTPSLTNIFSDGIKSKKLKTKYIKKLHCSWKDYFELFPKEMSYHTLSKTQIISCLLNPNKTIGPVKTAVRALKDEAKFIVHI